MTGSDPLDVPPSSADDEYLWSGTGAPSAEIVHLEAVLGPLRHRRGAPASFDAALDPLPPRELPAPAAAWHAWAVAASLALALAGPWMTARLWPQPPAWTGTWAESVGGDSTLAPLTLSSGAPLETGARHARIAVGTIGTVDLEPGTRVRLIDPGTSRHRLALDRGVLHATIWAPPGQFLVDTPSAVAIDLGCKYTLEVTAAGSGVLRVEVGWVGFAYGHRRVLVPAGAMAHTRGGIGPGTPFVDDLDPDVRDALDVIDFGAATAAARAAALARVLAAAREIDAITLWHLLGHVTPGERGLVFDRFAQLVPPPNGVTRDGIVRGDPAMLDAWWNLLGLGDAADWRRWTTQWSAGIEGTR